MRNSLTATVIGLTGAAAAGIALGFAVQALQGTLGGSSAVLANSGAVWVAVAFALGLVMPSPRVAAIGGATCLVAASICYYVAVDWFEDVASGPRGAVVWSVAGIVAGAAFGWAGFLARNNTQHRRAAWGLLAGVLIGEGIHLVWQVGNHGLRSAGIAELAVAAIIATLILRRARSGVLVAEVAAVTACAAGSTLLVLDVINRVFVAL